MDISVTINIKSEWVETAQRFAAEQHQPDRQQQIFLQTLAIYGLHEYLTWGEIEGSLSDSYSWHPQTRALTAWADLYLPNFGRILCVPNQKEETIQLPEILPLNCIGCVVVDVAENLQKLELQGFIPTRSFDLEKSQFQREDIAAIASLFDELYLLTEERLLVEREILQISAIDEDLEAYFSPLLDSENITDIVGRLNRLFYAPKIDLENVFIIDEVYEKAPEDAFTDLFMTDEVDEEMPTEGSTIRQEGLILNQPEDAFNLFAAIDEVDAAPLRNYSLLANEDVGFYSTDTPQQKIAEVTQALTENLLVKLQQLRDELA